MRNKNNREQETGYRLLIIDDHRAIHEDIKKIFLDGTDDAALSAMEAELFGERLKGEKRVRFEIDSAYQGRQGVALVRQARREGRPYTVAFVDLRMPPGWDGIETIKYLWREDPDLQVVICSAYSDYSWSEIVDQLGTSDRLLILKKPFDSIEIVQMAHALSHKWSLQQKVARTNEIRYRILYDDNPSMFLTLDAQGTVLSANRFGAEQLGYRVEELLGMPIGRLHGEDDQAVARERLEACFQQRDTVHRWETCLVRKDGTLLWVRQTTRVVESIDGAHTALAVCEDITEARQLSERLAYQATHDALTDLVNRREFERRLRRVLKTARANKTENALCYLDLDQFKIVNDTCGHRAGDELLRQIGGLLQERVRKRDTLARLGGDEFGILLEHCSLNQAERLADALRKAIEGFQFVWAGMSFRIGVSIGLAPITEASESVVSVMSSADSACYAAKDQGRNRIHVCHEDDAELARRRSEMQWTVRINQALEEGRFHLYYQPVVPLKGARAGTEHYELLLRMKDEAGTVAPPSAFLPAAERYGLVTRLDRWVVGTALSWLTRSPHALERLRLCSINLSGHTLGDKESLEFIIQRFAERRIPPEKICFEITETAAIANLADATRFIKALKALGCQFALDDFGSGLSSFAYLKLLPVDFLKIDGMFMKDIVDNPIGLAMVKSINEIGQLMGKKTIAEFVENEAILEQLKKVGVDYAQGYALGRPRPLEEIET